MSDAFEATSAGRLYNLLSDAKNVPGKNITIKQVWSSVFNTNDDLSLLFYHLRELQILVESIKSDAILFSGERKNNYLQYYNVIERLVNVTNFDLPWIDFKNGLNDSVMSRLTFMHYLFVDNKKENLIDSKEINAILDEINNLIGVISNSNEVDNDLRVFCIELLEQMRMKLLYYNIYGAKVIEDLLVHSYGKLCLNSSVYEQRNNKIVKSVFDVVTKLNSLYTFTKNVCEVCGGVAPMLQLIAGS